jgi:agmatinase
MKLHPRQFLDPGSRFCEYHTAAVAVLPFPYEGGISYGKGTAAAPDAVIDASHQIELYDEDLDAEPYRMGITTIAAPKMPKTPEEMASTLFKATTRLLNEDKFVVVVGGDHSITSPFFSALMKKYSSVSVIQIDAHADLRDSYNGSRLSHACVMARLREKTVHTLQIGIRSLSLEEAELIKRDKLSMITMREFRSGKKNIAKELKKLPDPVFLTFDVDAFDYSVIMNTGTPEPGGFSWDEAVELMNQVFSTKSVVGFDVAELSYAPWDRNSPVAVARLIYKMLGFKLASVIKHIGGWPKEPMGPILSHLPVRRQKQ